jgi:hypothetical protein
MKLIIAAVLVGISSATAFALDNSTNIQGQQGWTRCEVNCENDPNLPPILVKECKAQCKKGAVRKGEKATTKALDPNLPELMPDN